MSYFKVLSPMFAFAGLLLINGNDWSGVIPSEIGMATNLGILLLADLSHKPF